MDETSNIAPPQPNALTGDPTSAESIAGQLGRGPEGWTQGSPPPGVPVGGTQWWNEAAPPNQDVSATVNALSPQVAQQFGMSPDPSISDPAFSNQQVQAAQQMVAGLHPPPAPISSSVPQEYRDQLPPYLSGVNAQIQALHDWGLRNPPDFVS